MRPRLRFACVCIYLPELKWSHGHSAPIMHNLHSSLEVQPVLNIMASSAVLIPPSPFERNQKSLAEAPRFGNVSVITISRKTHHKPIYSIADTAAGLRNRCRSTSGKTSSRDNHFRGWFPLVLKTFFNLEFPLNFISSSQAANAS